MLIVTGGDRKTTKQVESEEAGIECPFMLRTESDDEFVSFTQQHVKKTQEGCFKSRCPEISKESLIEGKILGETQ